MSLSTTEAQLVYDGGTVIIPGPMGEPAPNQMKGTEPERLSEVASRICYDSLGVNPETGKPRGRSSELLHAHILEVGHTSVYEHPNFTVRITDYSIEPKLHEYYRALINRKGVWFEIGPSWLDVTLNLRTVLDWDKHSTTTNDSKYTHRVEFAVKSIAHALAPMVVRCPGKMTVMGWSFDLVKSEDLNAHQAWVSLYMRGSRGFCYDDQTEVLTDAGWRRFADLDGTESFATLNPVSHDLEYQTATASIDELYDGPMYRVRSQMVDLMVTPNHRMYLKKYDTRAARRGDEPWRILTAAEACGKRVRFKKNAKWVGYTTDHYSIPGTKGAGLVDGGQKLYHTKTFLRMLGYWLSEGWLEHSAGSGYQITISQNQGPVLDDIVACVRALGYSPNIKPNPSNPGGPNRLVEFWDKDLYLYLERECGRDCYTKRIPKSVKALSAELLNCLVDTLIAGDGSVTTGGISRVWTPGGLRLYPRAGGHRTFYTTSAVLADDMQEMALKIGQSASIAVVDRVGQSTTGQFAPFRALSYVVSFAGPKRQEPLINHNGRRHDSYINYSGRIYCVTVPNGILYVRRNGIPVWCGNSHEQVRHGDETGVSQRSTRYVDEDQSPYTDHPLIATYCNDPGVPRSSRAETIQSLANTRRMCSLVYENTVDKLFKFLVYRGVPKDIARKQSRGAARSYLGNGLETELIFSGSCAQWRHMIEMRGSIHADQEIREVYAKALPVLKGSAHGRFFSDMELVQSPDGIGHVVKIGAAV